MGIKNILTEPLDYIYIYGEINVVSKQQLIDSIIPKLIWMTYRKGYKSLISEFEVTSDKEWGCSIRAGQMLIANMLLLFKLLEKGSLLNIKEDIEELRNEIVEEFIDEPEKLLSIHNIVKKMNKENFCIGQYHSFFSPIKAMKEILKQKYKYTLIVNNHHTLDEREFRKLGFDTKLKVWSPFVLMFSLALGSSVQGKDNRDVLRTLVEQKTFAGMIIGVGCRAMYVYGISKNRLLYLDPHLSRKATYSLEEFLSESKCQQCNSIDISQIGNQVCIAFLFPSIAIRDHWFMALQTRSQNLISIIHYEYSTIRDPLERDKPWFPSTVRFRARSIGSE